MNQPKEFAQAVARLDKAVNELYEVEVSDLKKIRKLRARIGHILRTMNQLDPEYTK